MAAERFLSFRLPIFYSPPARVVASAMMDAIGCIGTPGCEQNMAAQVANAQSFGNLSMMVAAAATAKITRNIGGRVVNFVWDNAKKIWKEEKPRDFEELVDTHNMSRSVSPLPSPAQTPDKDQDKQTTDDDTQQPNGVAKEIERLDMKISDLTKRNDEQGRMIALHNKERLVQPQQQTADLPTNTQADGKQ